MKNTKEKKIKICSNCDRSFYPNEVIHYFESAEGDTLCARCGEIDLYIHDFTQYDEYPYVLSDIFDGGQYLGDPYKKISY